ncbi:MAG: DUF2993 domain-containing protein [Armatimonadota bacterium]
MKVLRTLLVLVGIIFGSLLIFLTAPGCARVAESKAEQAVNDLLPSFLGPADSYRTRVRGKSVGAVMRGRLDSVQVEGTNVRLDDGMTIDKLGMEFQAISIDTQARKLSHLGSAQFTARIGTVNLNRYVTVKRPTLAGLVITLGDGSASVEARPALLASYGLPGLKVPVAVEGKLVPTGDGTKLDFVPEGARVSVLPIPRPVIDYLARTLNPAVDLSSLPIPVRILDAQIRPDGVYLTGDAPSEDLLRAANKAAVPSPAPKP